MAAKKAKVKGKAAKKAPPKKAAKAKKPAAKPKKAPAKKAAAKAKPKAPKKAPKAKAPKKAKPKPAPKPKAAKAAKAAKPAKVAKAAAKAPPPKPSVKASPPPAAPSAKGSSKGIILPPRPSASQVPAAPSSFGGKKAPPPSRTGASPARPSSNPDALRIAPRAAPSVDGKGRAPAPPATGRPASKAQGLTLVRRPSDRPTTAVAAPLLPIPVRAVAAPPTLDVRAASIEKRLAAQTEEFRQRYNETFDMSWIFHDTALEGVVYTIEELRAGLAKGEPPPVVDSGLQPAVDEIRRHKEAIEFVRDFATKKRLPATVDTVKKIYLILHPSEGDLKTVKYRKDIPQHRLYFHEYAQPDKIAYKVRQIVDWLNDPETKKTRSALRIAARAHYDMLRVFPFQTDSGKVARLFMNLLLMRAGYPPSIIHSTERQRYYDALKGSANIVLSMVQESVENALASVEKLLDEHESKARALP